MIDTNEQLGRHLVQVLGRLDAITQPANRCCDDCGCLLRRGETCPQCALNNVQATS